MHQVMQLKIKGNKNELLDSLVTLILIIYNYTFGERVLSDKLVNRDSRLVKVDGHDRRQTGRTKLNR